MPPLCHSCCGPLGHVCGTVLGCVGATVAGTAVYLLDSTNAVISTATSDGSGAYCLPYTVAGTYKVKADAPASPAGYVGATAAPSSYTSGTTTGRNVQLGIDSANYVCACSPYPIKKVLNLSTPNGNVTATYNPAGVPPQWQASQTLTGSTFHCDPVTHVGSFSAGSYTVTYALTCVTPGNVWRFQWIYPGKYNTDGTAAACDTSRWGPNDDANTGSCGGTGVSQQSGMNPDQALTTTPFDLTYVIPASGTYICLNAFPSTTTVPIPIAGNYEWTF